MIELIHCLPRRPRVRSLALVGLVGSALLACTSRGSSKTQDAAPPDTSSAAATPVASPLPIAPWSGARLAERDIPAVYRTQWQKAENRATCAILAPDSLGDGTGATPRAATFSGGWAVAYDRPGMRSAFGIAGTGSSATDEAYDAWPRTLRWADGSSAGYGPEGGSGPNQLAYLRVTGQGCLYNVWSRLGVAHLERLLSHLRFVK